MGEQMLMSVADTAGPVNPGRVREVLRKDGVLSDDVFEAPGTGAPRITHLCPRSVAHLLALLAHPLPAPFPPADTGLIVLDSVSALFGAEFRPHAHRQGWPPAGTGTGESGAAAGEEEPDAAGGAAPNTATGGGYQPTRAEEHEDRVYWATVSATILGLRQLAVRLEAAVVVINDTRTQLRRPRSQSATSPGPQARLRQAVSGASWDAGVSARMVLAWAWLPERVARAARAARVRIAEVVLAGGCETKTRRVVPFVIARVSD